MSRHIWELRCRSGVAAFLRALLSATALIASAADVPPGSVSPAQRTTAMAAARLVKLSVPTSSAISRPGGHEVPTVRAAQGELVELLITSREPGMVTAHGVTDEVAVTPAVPAQIRISTSRSGRYAVHFHGKDGAHVMVVAIEVWPAQEISDRK